MENLSTSATLTPNADQQTSAAPTTAAPTTAAPTTAAPTGRRSKKAAEPVHVVLQTSRFRGLDGKAVARGRVALVAADRGVEMVRDGLARPASKADLAATVNPVVELA